MAMHAVSFLRQYKDELRYFDATALAHRQVSFRLLQSTNVTAALWLLQTQVSFDGLQRHE